MKRAADNSHAVRVLRAASAGETARAAAHALASGLGEMLGAPVAVDAGNESHIGPLAMCVDLGAAVDYGEMTTPNSPAGGAGALPDDGFAVSRIGGDDKGRGGAIVIRGNSERALMHGAYDLLEQLGAAFALGSTSHFPRIRPADVEAVASYGVTPSFARRAMVSDIMTWHYEDADRLRLHLAHDREFVPWMAQRKINSFSYIRHAQDTRLKIDQLTSRYAENGIFSEYGGHVLQILLPRERYAANPEYFPQDAEGRRMERGNLCVASRDAVNLVCEGALRLVRENPEIALLHIWGADVWGGAWCRCAQCASTTPQLQYMKVVNALALALGRERNTPPIAYLAYHDTIEPDPSLRPLANVWFEWAPRERCYSHAIDDPGCPTNPRYLESLKRYIDLFDGRGHVFEYYADAILFGGLGFASPSVIVRDLRAYHRLGLRSISCLTFGAFSTFAYPVNLETFARTAVWLDSEPDPEIDRVAARRHPGCAAEMGMAYRTVAQASAMVLNYGDVMRPPAGSAQSHPEALQLRNAAKAFRNAIAAADRISAKQRSPLIGAERDLWKYSVEALDGLAAYVAAMAETGSGRKRAGERAVNRISEAMRLIGAIDVRFAGTWAAYDLERLREIWMSAMRRRLEA